MTDNTRWPSTDREAYAHLVDGHGTRSSLGNAVTSHDKAHWDGRADHEHSGTAPDVSGAWWRKGSSSYPAKPFNREAAENVDAYVAKDNRRRAIAEVTKLPALTLELMADEQAVAQTTPQANSVSWALWVGREYKLDGDETLALVGLAQHAAAALFSGDGYTYTTALELSAMLHWPQHLVRRVLEPRGHVWPLVEDRCDVEGNNPGWRIPEEALNGNWLDRAARRAHYVKATDEVRR